MYSLRNRIFLLAVLLLFVGCDSDMPEFDKELEKVQQAETWNAAGDPERFTALGASYNYKLGDLPMSGMAEQETWAGWYWATWKDAVNYKWDGDDTDSPVAKYAKAFGIDPLALENAVSRKSGIDSRASAKTCEADSECDAGAGEKCAKRSGQETGKCIPTWFGQCHAWAPAAVMEPEPKDAVTVNGVTFKAQDIKALMTYVYNNVQTDFLGGRCNTDEKEIEFDQYGRPKYRECRDINPGTLHVILGNWIGIHKKAIVEDRTWDDEVWNQPVRGYEITRLEEVSEASAANLVGVSNVGGTEVNETGSLRKGDWKHFGPYSSESGITVHLTGSGDADLYVLKDSQPTSTQYDCRPYKGGDPESCAVNGSGEFYVSVTGYSDTSEFKLDITYGGKAEYVFNPNAAKFFHVNCNVKYITESSPNRDGNLNEDTYTRTDEIEYILELDEEGSIVGGEWIKKNLYSDFLWVPTATAGDFHVGQYVFEYSKIKNLLQKSIGISDNTAEGETETVTVNESGTIAKDNWSHFGPFAATNGISVRMTGTGDADLYVRKGTRPSATNWVCRPYQDGSGEECNLTGAGSYYVAVVGYADSSDFDLTIEYRE